MIAEQRFRFLYSLVIALALTVGVLGAPGAFECAILIGIAQIAHFYLKEKDFKAFPVQVRVGIFLMLLLAYPPPLRWLYWVPLAGSWANVIFGYCLMARVLALAPWNREGPLTVEVFKRAIFSRPVKGSILENVVNR